MGIPTPHKSCRVCQKLGAGNETEPRFLFTYCPVHANVPPTHLKEAEAQYKAHGCTKWDITGISHQGDSP